MATGMLQKEIASILGKSPSTISRELKRDSPHRVRSSGKGRNSKRLIQNRVSSEKT